MNIAGSLSNHTTNGFIKHTETTSFTRENRIQRALNLNGVPTSFKKKKKKKMSNLMSLKPNNKNYIM
jgi:hypothetical protein